MVWNEELKREIPYGWEVRNLSELAPIITGKKDANYAIQDGNYKFFTCATIPSKCNDYVFDGKAVLIAGNGDFNVKHFSGKFDAYQRTYVLIPNEERYYGIIYLSTLRTVSKFKKQSNGSIVKFITKSDVENIKILIPNTDTDTDIYYLYFNKVLDYITKLQSESETLSTLRDWLLPMLMNGQATVLD